MSCHGLYHDHTCECTREAVLIKLRDTERRAKRAETRVGDLELERGAIDMRLAETERLALERAANLCEFFESGSGKDFAKEIRGLSTIQVPDETHQQRLLKNQPAELPASEPAASEVGAVGSEPLASQGGADSRNGSDLNCASKTEETARSSGPATSSKVYLKNGMRVLGVVCSKCGHEEEVGNVEDWQGQIGKVTQTVTDFTLLLRVLKDRAGLLEAHGCTTGDCLHDKQAECDADLAEYAAAVLNSINVLFPSPAPADHELVDSIVARHYGKPDGVAAAVREALALKAPAADTELNRRLANRNADLKSALHIAQGMLLNATDTPPTGDARWAIIADALAGTEVTRPDYQGEKK